MSKQLKIWVACCLLINNWTYCQQRGIDTAFLSKTFDYKIIRTMPQLLDTNNLKLSEFIVVTNLDKSIRKKLKKLKVDEWLRLLQNDLTDWAANLYLYEIYHRDAYLFQIISSKEKWKTCCKEEDIIFWKNKLLGKSR